MAPRFTNPHSLREDIEIVSRAVIDADHNVPRVEHENDNADSLAVLERILKRSLGESLNLREEATESVYRKKKRKLDTIENDTLKLGEFLQEEPVSFRLVGRSTTLVLLRPKPPPEIKTYEPSYEDDEKEAIIRAQRATAVAIDASDIIEQSQIPSYPSSRTRGKVISLTVSSQELESMVIIERQKQRKGFGQVFLTSLLRIPEKTRPSPHDIPADRGLYCSVVKTDSTSTQPVEKKRGRRKHAVTEQEVHPPSFFRPQQEWGGKSAGYALGYAGSRPVPMGRTRQWTYRRDTTKKGIMSRW